MLNNKGLVVSSVLYTLLIAFLLFLGVTLAQFSSSAKIISNSTKDLVNNSELKGNQVHEVIDSSKFKDSSKYNAAIHNCSTTGSMLDNVVRWFNTLEKNEYGQVADDNLNGIIEIIDSQTVARIYSRYGTAFWPRDFDPTNGSSKINKLRLTCVKQTAGDSISCDFLTIKNYVGVSSTNYVTITVEDTATGDTNSFFISNTCN